MKKVKTIILAGGSGTRLWPLSRERYPKQFIKLQGLENPGKTHLEIIEVQMGQYLEEDDIVRFDDEYGRK